MDVAGVLSQLAGLVDQLAAADLSALSDDELQLLAEGTSREQSRLATASAPVLVEWERRGAWRASRARTAGLALANPLHRCHHVVADELGRAGKLVDMPATRAAVLDGRLSFDHVELFCRYNTERRRALFARDEQMLVDLCAGFAVFSDARKALRYWADHADDELGESTRLIRSDLSAPRSRDSGVMTLRGTLAPIDAEQVAAELERLSREIRHEDRAAGVERTATERRAAALVRMAQRSASASGITARPLFQVVVGDRSLSRLLELASGTVIRPEELLPYVDTALVESFLFDDEHRLVGASRQRTFRGRLRRAVQVRDRRCQDASGCPVPADDLHTDVDHVIPWSHGGATAIGNGKVRCHTHNRHEHMRSPGGDPPPGDSPHTAAFVRSRWRDPDEPCGDQSRPTADRAS